MTDATDRDDDDEALERPARAKKKPKKRRRARASEPYDWRHRQADERRWTTGQLLSTLAIGAVLGGIGGYAARGAPQGVAQPGAPTTSEPQAPSAPGSAAPAGTADSFGRAPGDPHFGHAHPPEQGGPAPAAPAGSGPDSFGRSPGDQHFGHDHQ